MIDIVRFQSQQTFETYFNHSPVRQIHIKFEQGLMDSRQALDEFELEGYCQACEQNSPFLVDKRYGSQQTEQGWMPNWRERLICPSCQLNNRQRAMIHVLKQAVAARQHEETADLKLYAMEQITPLFTWLQANLSIACTGSEYLGEDIQAHGLIDGIMSKIRHENVQALSFADNHFDFIVSNDVLEHVDQPRLAITEMMRVLKSGGQIFVSIPFHANQAHSCRRAEWVDGELLHYQAEQYHGNPLSEKGSLVFHDYGWDFIDWLKQAGFQDPALCSYWSYLYGYLGDPQYYFHATKA